MKTLLKQTMKYRQKYKKNYMSFFNYVILAPYESHQDESVLYMPRLRAKKKETILNEKVRINHT